MQNDNRLKLSTSSSFARVAVVSHVLGGAHAQDMAAWFRRHGAEETLFIGHPLEYVAGWPGSISEVYRREHLSRRRELRARKLPPIADYVIHTLLTLWWVIGLRRRWDVMIACDPLNTFAALILRRLGLVRKVAYYTIDYVPQRFANRRLNDLYHRLDRFCVRHADATWNVSGRIAEGREAVRGMSRSEYPRQITVPIAMDVGTYPSVPFEETEESRLIYAGGLLPHQGVQLVLDAVPAIVEAVPGFVFEITGRGPMEPELRKQIARMGIERSVRFTGYLDSREELRRRMTTAGIGVAMYSADLDRWSRYADPSKIKDYVASGLPVITTDVTSAAVDIDLRGCGFVIPYDKHELAQCVIKLMTTPQLRHACRDRALEYARQFDFDVVMPSAMRSLSDPPTDGKKQGCVPM